MVGYVDVNHDVYNSVQRVPPSKNHTAYQQIANTSR